MAGEMDAIRAAGKMIVGVYKWARTTEVGKATTAAAVAGAALASERLTGKRNHALEHKATDSVSEHIAKPVVKSLTSFLRSRR
jgi:hypothetical protein